MQRSKQRDAFKTRTTGSMSGGARERRWRLARTASAAAALCSGGCPSSCTLALCSSAMMEERESAGETNEWRSRDDRRALSSAALFADERESARARARTDCAGAAAAPSSAAGRASSECAYVRMAPAWPASASSCTSAATLSPLTPRPPCKM